MNKFINFIGVVVLFGILVKLSYVFVYLFDQLDGGGVVASVTGVTFAFASIYFVVKKCQWWLKVTMVLLDVSIILYYYLHEQLNMNIAYASIIVAAYSGIIIYHVGKIVAEQVATVDDTSTKRERIETERLRTVNDLQAVQKEKARVERCLRESKGEDTKTRHREALAKLEAQEQELQEKLNLLK